MIGQASSKAFVEDRCSFKDGVYIEVRIEGMIRNYVHPLSNGMYLIGMLKFF